MDETTAHTAEMGATITEARAEVLEEAAADWPASGMTRAEAQAWLQGRATRERNRSIPPTGPTA